MRKYHVEITKVAERDIESTFEYICQDNAEVAVRWVKELEHQIDSLENFPKRCATIPEARELGQEYRHLIYGDYRTIFRVQSPKVTIMRVIHSARLLDLRMFEKILS